MSNALKLLLLIKKLLLMPKQSADTPNVLQVMMQLEQVKNRSKSANKVALEVKKEKDDVEKEVEELNASGKPSERDTRVSPVSTEASHR